MSDDARAALAASIETIETAYEYMLAYAAQGRDQESQTSGPSVRSSLMDFHEALQRLPSELDACVDDDDYQMLLTDDAARARAVIAFALATDNLSSQLVDNLNASMHLRTLLTDLFVVDEALKQL